MACLVPHSLQFLNQMPNTLRCPSQGGFRISALCWVDELLQIRLQRRVSIDRPFPPSGPPDSTCLWLGGALELFDIRRMVSRVTPVARATMEIPPNPMD
jgi:hypothetical protein